MIFPKGHPVTYVNYRGHGDEYGNRRKIPALKYHNKKAIVYKKAMAPQVGRGIGGWCDVIVELEISPRTRVIQARGYKCRAASAKVLSITEIRSGKKRKVAVSDYDTTFKYHVGKVVRPTGKFDLRICECSDGIHFFLTRDAAEEYWM